MRYNTHISEGVSVKLSQDGKHILCRDSRRDESVAVPIELLQLIQDDLWAHDTSGHNARKSK